MKILKWIFELIFKDNFSYFEFVGIVFIAGIADKYSDSWLLLLFLLYFINRFISELLELLDQKTETKPYTYYFDNIEESQKFFMNNLKELREQSATLIVNNQSTKSNL